ncbi:MAG: signal peptidase I [Dehalococcoidia bacterium]
MCPGNLVLLAAVVILAAWFVLLRPAFLGGPATYVRVTGDSMEPTLDAGDLVLARVQGSYGEGDIVAFRPPRHTGDRSVAVIHRIVGGSPQEGFIMQGDNNEGKDPWLISEGDILGEMWFSAPGGGRLLTMLQSPVVLAALASGVAVFLVLSGGGEKKRPRELSPAKRPDRPRRLRLPPGLTLWQLLILTATLVASQAFTARH